MSGRKVTSGALWNVGRELFASGWKIPKKGKTLSSTASPFPPIIMKEESTHNLKEKEIFQTREKEHFSFIFIMCVHSYIYIYIYI